MNEARLRAAADERTSVMARIDCLSDDELLALQFGILDEVALENLAGHLERCPRCEHRARACDGESDELMAALRRSRNATRNDAVAIPVPTPSTLGFLAPAQAPDELGRLGPYRVRKLLGQGGMGMVFLAEDLQLERPVALKVLLPDRAANSEARQRFVREAKAAAQLKHDHIVTIYQVGEDNGVCWLAMEYLEGESLDDWLAPGRRPNLSAILRMAREVAEGLSAAHERQLVHRDIKPANVWIERSTGRAKILDFGLARPERDDVRITTSDTIVGTPAYMSPEQAHGGNLDGRSDLFSLGCLLYELLTGQLPFRGDTAMATLMALALDPPTPIRELEPAVPDELADLVMQLLAKRPVDRPPTAKIVADRLAELETAFSIRPLSSPTPLPLSSRPVSPATIRSDRPLANFTPSEAAARSYHRVDPEVETPTQQLQLVRSGIESASADSQRSTSGMASPSARSNRRRGLGILCVLGGLAVGLAAAQYWTGFASREPSGKVVDWNDDFREDWARRVSELPAAQQVEEVFAAMKRRNPRFEGYFKPNIQDDRVVALEFPTDAVSDLRPLRALAHLRRLVAKGGRADAGSLTDLTPLTSLNLVDLQIAGNPRLDDIAPLRGKFLEFLDLSHTSVSDLRPLAGMKSLSRLWLVRTPVRDLAPLKGLGLSHLAISHAAIRDVSPLIGSTTLRTLHFRNTPIDDFSFLETLPRLEDIDADVVPLRHACSLRHVAKRINGKPAKTFLLEIVEPEVRAFDRWLKETLPLPPGPRAEAIERKLRETNHLAANAKLHEKSQQMRIVELTIPADHLTELSPLRAIPELERLTLTRAQARPSPLRALGPLRELKALTRLECSHTIVWDLTPVVDLPVLTYLDIRGTAVTDLTPLKRTRVRELWCDYEESRDRAVLSEAASLEMLNGRPREQVLGRP
jgi:serine/threonine protein kinase/Leucine-rich repeat (LRR) protein